MTPQTLTARPGALAHRRIALTGKLASMTRREAYDVIRDAGGELVEHVSRRTSMLVVGMGGWPLLSDGSVSNKLRRAQRLNRSGAKIEIISEELFLEQLGPQPPQRQVHKRYDAARICAVLSVSPETLQRWELLSLIRPQDGAYDYQDVVSLRTIAELVHNGVRPETIATSLRSLQSVLPQVDRPLAQLSLVAENRKSLLAEIGPGLMSSSGQLVWDFESEPTTARVLELQPARSADEWLERGIEAEQQERYHAAERACRQALSLNPCCVEAYFNLGNVLRAQGRLDAAAEAFHAAVVHDTAFEAAHFNLADIYEEQGNLELAKACLQAALAASPAYADAHFNLAHVYERIGQSDLARQHWRAYLKLDPASEWAELAREKL